MSSHSLSSEEPQTATRWSPAKNAATSSSTSVAASASGVVQTQPGQKRIFKIIVIGDSNVGKTCLTFRFCGGKFPEKCEATIGVDFREKTMQIGNEEIKLQIWDTAGQERFRRSMVQHYYRNVHAVVFVYDVTKISTFDNLTHWVEECAQNSLGTNVPRILVGNKSDQKDRISVTTSMAQKFAEFHDMILFETSAKDEHETNQVDGIFMTIACRLINSKSVTSSSTWSSTSMRATGDSGGGHTLRELGESSGHDTRQTDGVPCLC